MKILFVSCCIPDELEHEITQYCKQSINIHDAANTFQKSLIHGFIENGVEIDVITAPSLPAYPMGYKVLHIPQLSTLIEGKMPCQVLPYNTLVLTKYTNMERLLVKYATEWIEHNSQYELAIIVYNINSAFMGAIKKVKKRYPNVTTSIIVTDMIEDVDNFAANRTYLKRIQQQLHKRKVFASYEAIDKYILLSEQMKERIPNCKDNYIVVEGIYTRPQEIQHDIPKEKVVFYSGALDTFVNVPEMVEAFKGINKADYKLVVCGAGPLADYIKNEAEKNKNIEYLGSIPRREVLEWQRKSSLLINPRKPSEITKYSFPSKTMEYFTSGTPVLMYKLQGIPEEYYSYCYTIAGISVEEFKDSLERVLSISAEQSKALGARAKDFILKNKNSQMQVNRIMEFLSK